MATVASDMVSGTLLLLEKGSAEPAVRLHTHQLASRNLKSKLTSLKKYSLPLASCQMDQFCDLDLNASPIQEVVVHSD